MPLLGRVPTVGRVPAVRWSGFDASFSPDSISDLWNLDPRNTTLGSTLAATGTTPPVVTLSGTLTTPLGVRTEIQTTGVLGASTFRVSINNGTSYVASGVTTVATYAIPGTALTLNFPSGTYTNDNVYRATAGTARDTSTFLQDASNATAANQPFFTSSNASFNGNPTWDWPNATASALDTASFAAKAAPITIVAVAQATVTTQCQLFQGIGGTTLSVRQVATAITMLFGTGGNIQFPGNMQQPAILIVEFAASGIITGWMRGNFMANRSTTVASGITQFRLGNLTALTFPWNGSIADVRMMSKTLSLAERRNVFAYFSAKHNIPVALAT